MTGNFKSSATDSKVFIQIFGENGETGKRWLNSSNKPNDELFAKGSVSRLSKITNYITQFNQSNQCNQSNHQ